MVQLRHLSYASDTDIHPPEAYSNTTASGSVEVVLGYNFDVSAFEIFCDAASEQLGAR
jgi:hypothetical protein